MNDDTTKRSLTSLSCTPSAKKITEKMLLTNSNDGSKKVLDFTVRFLQCPKFRKTLAIHKF